MLKNYEKSEEYIGSAHYICNLNNIVPKKVLIVFNEGYSYDYHFILKELEEGLKKQFTYLVENTEKYKAFTVPIEGEVTRIIKT